MTTLEIRAVWDDEANVWVADSDDVPGLIAEAVTLESLVAKLETPAILILAPSPTSC